MALVTDCMNGSRFQWTKEAKDAIQLIKVRLTTAPILVLSDFSQPFELHCNASKVGTSAVFRNETPYFTFYSLSRASFTHHTN